MFGTIASRLASSAKNLCCRQIIARSHHCTSSHNLGPNVSSGHYGALRLPQISKMRYLTPIINNTNINFELPSSFLNTTLNPSFPAHGHRIKELNLPPATSILEKLDPVPKTEIVAPNHDVQIIEKYAARLIKIRRKKMRKHKLRKLRKRMRFRWGQIRQKREWRKETLFQNKLLSQIAESEKFEAEDWVKGILNRVKNQPVLETKEERRKRLVELMRKNKGRIWL